MNQSREFAVKCDWEDYVMMKSEIGVWMKDDFLSFDQIQYIVV